jgi:hypothetical protein
MKSSTTREAQSCWDTRWFPSIFMETEHSIPNAQELSTNSNPEPDQSNMVGGFPVTTAWRVLGLRMEERPPAMEGSCEHIE